MKDACEDCGYKPDDPEYAEDDLVECQGCGKTICVGECVFDSEIINGVHELYWCGDCEHTEGRQMICFAEKTPALAWGRLNQNWYFWWFGIAIGQIFIGVMVRTKVHTPARLRAPKPKEGGE